MEGGRGGRAVEPEAASFSSLLPPPPLLGNEQFYLHPDRTRMYSNGFSYYYDQGYSQGPSQGYSEPTPPPFEDYPSYCRYGGYDWGTDKAAGIDDREKELFGDFYGGSNGYCCDRIATEEEASHGKKEEEQISHLMDAISEFDRLRLHEESLNHTLLTGVGAICCSPDCLFLGCAFNSSPILGDDTVHKKADQKTLKEPMSTVVGGDTRISEDIDPDNIIVPESVIVPDSITVPESAIFPDSIIFPETICLAKEERGLPSAFHLNSSRYEMLGMSICNLSQVLAEKQAAGLSGETEVKYIESTICNLSYCLLELTKKGKYARTKQGVKNQLITDSMDAEANSDLVDMQKVLDFNDKESIRNCPLAPSYKKDNVRKLSKECELKKVPMQDEGRLLEEIEKLKTSFSELKDRILNEVSENSAILDMYKKLWIDTESSLGILRLEMLEAKQSIKDLNQMFMLMHKSEKEVVNKRRGEMLFLEECHQRALQSDTVESSAEEAFGDEVQALARIEKLYALLHITDRPIATSRYGEVEEEEDEGKEEEDPRSWNLQKGFRRWNEPLEAVIEAGGQGKSTGSISSEEAWSGGKIVGDYFSYFTVGPTTEVGQHKSKSSTANKADDNGEAAAFKGHGVSPYEGSDWVHVTSHMESKSL